MSSVFSFLGFRSETTTTARVSTPEILNINDNSLAAVTQARCSATFPAAAWRHELHHQLPKSSAQRIHKGAPSLRYNTIIRYLGGAGPRTDDDRVAGTASRKGVEANPKDRTDGREIGPRALCSRCASQPGWGVAGHPGPASRRSISRSRGVFDGSFGGSLTLASVFIL